MDTRGTGTRLTVVVTYLFLSGSSLLGSSQGLRPFRVIMLLLILLCLALLLSLLFGLPVPSLTLGSFGLIFLAYFFCSRNACFAILAHRLELLLSLDSMYFF
jgi:hypothetical protein